jgi:protoheme ferro-lyase
VWSLKGRWVLEEALLKTLIVLEIQDMSSQTLEIVESNQRECHSAILPSKRKIGASYHHFASHLEDSIPCHFKAPTRKTFAETSFLIFSFHSIPLSL